MIQIAFSEIPTFQNMMNASTLLGLDTKLNRDSLYDELVETKLVFESIISQSTASVSVTQKWQQYFTVCRNSAMTNAGLWISNYSGSVVYSRKQRFLRKSFFL